ncbi:hypothetical protein [Kordiimonas pumila]|uniref:Uncharacterized protein n=1 Tax=Kordiimonas pumila TaxID=2161677 RepID=A0ABV7D023_9PROT|nr:hypothetical protein [Kordiimonas pumila]
MKNSETLQRGDLLKDIKQSIERAFDADMVDLAGALLRLQASTQGWCELADCGPCPLGPMMCLHDRDERVGALIQRHHNNKSEDKLLSIARSNYPAA